MFPNDNELNISTLSADFANSARPRDCESSRTHFFLKFVRETPFYFLFLREITPHFTSVIFFEVKVRISYSNFSVKQEIYTIGRKATAYIFLFIAYVF